MKARSKVLLTVFLIFALALISAFALTPLTASARDREITAVDSGNSFNMRLNSDGVLTWDEIPGATGYKVVLLNSMNQSIWEWDNDLTNNSRVLPFIVEMDNRKYDSGRYVIEVVAKDTSNKNSISYYYTSNVDKLEEPRNLKWLGNQANWEYVDGATKYTVSLFNFEGLVAREVVTECPVDFSEHNPQDGWTFTVQAETNGALNDKRNSNVAESPKKGSDARTINTVDSGNALNMKIVDGVLTWNEVLGATGYQVILKNPVGLEIYRWDNDLTNNARVLSIISEMDNLKVNSGHYRIEVEPKDAGTVAIIANYFYTSNVEQFEAPHNLRWNGATATWATVDGAFSYKVTLYDFNGQVKTVTVTDDWYDFSEYNPQDGWTFTVQAEGNNTLNAKRSSNATESPAKTTSYNLSVVAYGIGNLEGTGKVSLETENVTQDFASSVGGSFIKNTEITVKAEANPGYEFVGWRHTAPENSEETLSTNETYIFDLTTNLQLFAVFRTIPTEYSVTYHGNGATGGMADETVIAGGTYTLDDCGYDTPYGKKFIGWAIGSADATPIMQPGDEITINADTTIYAVWENIYFITQPTDTSGKIGTNVKLPVTINLLQVPDEDSPYIHLEVMNGVTWEKVAEAKRSEWALYDNGFSVQQNTACIKSYQYKIYNGSEWIESDTFTVEFLPLVVSFEDSTHSTTTAPVEIDTVGGTVSKPADPVAAGDTFSCWWNNGPWDFESNTITKDVTLFASWLGTGFYSEIPDVYAKLGAQARIDLSGVNYNNNYTYVYKYDGANWVQGEAVTNYSYFNLPASAVETVETYKIVINAATPVESNVFTVTWTDTTYTLSFNANGGSGTMDNVNTIGSYTLPLCDFNAPEGYRFAGWATTADGEVIDSATYMILEDTQLFAIWEEIPTFFVVYAPGEGNGSTDLDEIEEGATITLFAPADLDFTAQEGMTFSHWKVCKDNALDPNFVEKQPGDEITITFETYIIAVWEELPTFFVVYAPGEGNGSTDLDSIYEGATITLLAPADLDFTAQEGMRFAHWKVCKDNASDPNFVEKQPGDEITITFETYIIAVWEEIPTFFVVYAPGEGNGSTDLDSIYEGATITLLYPDDLDFTAQEDMRFLHWKVCKDNASDPNFVIKQPGDEITITFETYIIAVWEEIPSYIVSYESNGGSGTMIGDTVKEGEVFILDECAYEAPLGYKFKAWAIGALDGDQLNPGNVIPVTSEVIIYAIWEVIGNFTVTYYPNGGEGEMAEATVEENSIFVLGECEFTAPGNLVFKAWAIGSLEGEQKMPYEEIIITADTKLYAIWQDPPHACIAELKEGKDATCTENGWKDYYQCECGNLFADEDRITPIDDLDAWKVGAGQILASHTYGNLVAEEGAVHTQTELKAGMKAHYYCAVCDTYFDENKAQTTQDALIIPAPQHVYGGFITSDPAQHWKQCTCGLKSEIADHTYDDELDNDCNQCGHERDSIHECVGILQDGKKATCTENGWKEYYQCVCNKFYADQSCESEILDLEAWKVGEGKIPAGHEYGDLVEKVDATCSETGKQAHYKCSVCGTLFDENKQVKTEIELTIDVDVNAHKFGDWTSNGDGTHTRVCSINGDHKQTENCSGGEATCTERATCSICETAYGSVKAHEYGDLIEKIDATCSEAGKQAHYQCSVCGTLFDENKQVKTEIQLTIEVDANAHKFGDWTSNGDGTHTRVCSTNGDHKQTEDCSGGEATCTVRAICSTCGNAYGSVKAHDFGTEWKSDENNHWKECACGEKSEQGAHADLDENGACDTCGRELPQKTPEIKPDEPEKDGLSGGAIAGIAVAGVAVAGMGGFAIFWFVIKKKTIADLIAIFKKK